MCQLLKGTHELYARTIYFCVLNRDFMIYDLPVYIPITFILVTIITILFLYKAGIKTKQVLFVIIIWLVFHALLAFNGFYEITNTMPPRFILMIIPPVLLILLLFFSAKGRSFIDSLDIQWLTWLHVVRIPMEFVLLWLFMHKQIPQIMTFEGKNFDIISGSTAPLIVWLGFHKRYLNKKILIGWNFICLALLFIIVTLAVFSLPVPFQQMAFDQPNVAIMYFPFVWLPAFVVPAVLFAHLVTIRQLLKPGR
jgi:hypothetical protein